MDIGELIRSARRNKGVTQKELAEKLNITQTAIAKYESINSNPSISTLMKIAEALNVNVSIDFQTEKAAEQLSNQEQALLELFNKLNQQGKEQALIMIHVLTEIENNKN